MASNSSVFKPKPLKLCGLDVKFPYEKPYQQQMAMMSRLIMSLKKKENCLIESPTGTGKSLSLLCAALSYLESQKIAFDHGLLSDALSMPGKDDSCCRASKANSSCAETPKPSLIPTQKYRRTPNLPPSDNEVDDHFAVIQHRKRTFDEMRSPKKSLLNSSPCEPHSITEDESLSKSLNVCESPSAAMQIPPNVKLTKPPKIFYGTRTHRQVAQVVAELRRTDYRHMRMSILASREKFCINEEVRAKKETSLADECKRVRNDKGCNYYENLAELNRTAYPTDYTTNVIEPWDIEDLITIGKDEEICPYFWAIETSETADIIFCPYNYIIDPNIRELLNIKLENNIVLLDEAHNIEDICRNSMGVEILLSDLKVIVDNIEQLLRQNMACHDHARVASIIGGFIRFLSDESQKANSSNSITWMGKMLSEKLEMVQLGPMTFPKVKPHLIAVSTVEKKDDDNKMKKTGILNAGSRSVLQSIVNTCHYMYKSDCAFLDSFRGSIRTNYAPKFKRNNYANERQVCLQIYCLNPAVAIHDIKKEVHSLVVASGTLSPLESFSCELDVPFQGKVQLSHVIKSDQLFAACITRGPNNVQLICDYKHMSEWSLQDELGLVLLKICEIVPFGVLCFFPSYNTLSKLAERWEITGCYSKIENAKHVFSEADKLADFDETMQNYYTAAVKGKGALLLAVCRGKVSEGQDFPNNFARATVTIGIPFPNVKDEVVANKRVFNDSRLRKNDKVMSGEDWYKAQAFRAMNQALGRCIRHSKDWGALIIIDDRISSLSFNKMISNWIRDSMVSYNNFDAAADNLVEFISRQNVEMNVQSENLIVTKPIRRETVRKNAPVLRARRGRFGRGGKALPINPAQNFTGANYSSTKSSMRITPVYTSDLKKNAETKPKELPDNSTVIIPVVRNWSEATNEQEMSRSSAMMGATPGCSILVSDDDDDDVAADSGSSSLFSE